MKSKTAQRILEETPQEVKDRVKALTNRELELLQMGFLITINLSNLQIPFLFITFADKKIIKNETIQNLHKR